MAEKNGAYGYPTLRAHQTPPGEHRHSIHNSASAACRRVDYYTSRSGL